MRYGAEPAFLFLLLTMTWSAPHAGEAAMGPVRTDLNLVTAIDVSGSIDGRAERVELLGMADALIDSAFLQAIEGGMNQRIGFVAFTWSSQGDFVELVPWTTIESRADAEHVAARLRAARSIQRFGPTTPWQSPARRPWRTGLGTDISATLEHAMDALRAVPFWSERGVINICANGEDNIREGPDRVRDVAAAQGIVINGVILSKKPEAWPTTSAPASRPARAPS